MEQEDLRTDLEGKNRAWPLITENNFTLSPRKNTPPFASVSFSFQLILVRLGCLLQKLKKSKHSLKSLSLPAKMKQRARSLIKVQPQPQAKSRFTYFVNASLEKINFTILQYFWKMYLRVYGNEN